MFTGVYCALLHVPHSRLFTVSPEISRDRGGMEEFYGRGDKRSVTAHVGFGGGNEFTVEP